MATDQLILGGFVFDGFSPPETMGGGGKQAMAVHKLPGGQRVIDTLGPDEADVTWSGFFYGDDAYGQALALDGMRAAGQEIPLIWGGQFRQVIIAEFTYHVRRMPAWVEYSITCVVSSNPANGGGGGFGGGGLDAMLSADLSKAMGF